jgi:hypothetical protein
VTPPTSGHVAGHLKSPSCRMLSWSIYSTPLVSNLASIWITQLRR